MTTYTTAAPPYTTDRCEECNSVRLRLVGSTWVGIGHVAAADLDRAVAIASASPYAAELTDAFDPTMRVAGWTDHRRRRIRVRVEGHFLLTLAHEVFHSCLPWMPQQDADHVLLSASRQFPQLTDFQRSQAWQEDAEEKAAMLFGCWRVNSACATRPDNKRTVRIFHEIASGRFAEG